MWGRETSTLILQPSFLIRKQPEEMKKKKKIKKTLSQLLFLQLGSDQLPKCVPGARLSLNCLFYWSTDHIWKSLGRLRSPLALMRARAQRKPPAWLPGSCLSLSLLGKGFFSRAKSCHHPLFFPFPPLILGRSLFQAKSCNSHQNPNSSGVQSLKLNVDPASLRDG